MHVLTEQFICLYLVTWVENIWVRQWWAVKKSTSNTFTMKFGFHCPPTFQKVRLSGHVNACPSHNSVDSHVSILAAEKLRGPL